MTNAYFDLMPFLFCFSLTIAHGMAVIPWILMQFLFRHRDNEYICIVAISTATLYSTTVGQ